MQYIKDKNIPLTLQLVKADLTYESAATVEYNIYNSDMTTLVLSGYASFSNIMNSYTATLASSGWANQEAGNYVLVWDISNTTNFASTIVEELIITGDVASRFDDVDAQLNIIEGNTDTIISDVADMQIDVKRLLGLMHENIFIDNTIYDAYHNLSQARVRIYSDAASVGTDNNIIGTYQLDCTTSYQGKFTTWQQVKT